MVKKKSTRGPETEDDDDSRTALPLQPPVRVMTPASVNRDRMSTEGDHDGDESTIATLDMPPPPPMTALRGRGENLPMTPPRSYNINKSNNRSPVRGGSSEEQMSNRSPTNRDAILSQAQALTNRSRLPPSNAVNRSRSRSNDSINHDMSDGQFQVKSYMASIGNQENTNTSQIPGAIAVQGSRSTENSFVDSPYDNIGEPSERDVESATTTTTSAMLSPSPVVAQLALDYEAEVEARLAQRLERQITDQVEEEVKRRMLANHSRTNGSTTTTTVTGTPIAVVHPGSTDTVDSTDSKRTPPTTSSMHDRPSNLCCGLRRRSWGYIAVLFLLVAGGVAAGVYFYFEGQDDNDNTTVNESDEGSSISPPTDPLLALLRETLLPILARNDNEISLIDDPDQQTPQSLAWTWLEADFQTMAASASASTMTSLTSTMTIELTERYVLAVLFFSTNGPSWRTYNFGFLSNNEHVCEWNNGLDPSLDLDALGVFCDSSFPSTTTAATVTTNGRPQRVTTLLLNDNALSGTLPWELSLLNDLEICEFDLNNIGGKIPSEMSQDLTNLFIFWIHGSLLSGALMDNISPSGWNAMESLDVSNNFLTGTIPSEWSRQMPNLFFLAMGNNRLRGTIPPSLTDLIRLEHLDLGQNELSGKLPTISFESDTSNNNNNINDDDDDGNGNFFYNMSNLFLEDNRFTGSIPSIFGRLTNLEVLALNSNNDLTGTVPTEFGQLTSLQRLDIFFTNLEGTIDTSICSGLPFNVEIVADCGVVVVDNGGGTTTTTTAEISCTCCTECCTDTNGCYQVV